MKKLVDLIEIENAFVKESEKITKLYSRKTHDYIANTKEQISSLQSDIVNKSSIVKEKLSEHTMQSATQSNISSKNINHQKAKEIILSQL